MSPGISHGGISEPLPDSYTTERRNTKWPTANQFLFNTEIAEKLFSNYFVSQPPLQFLNVGNPGLRNPKPEVPLFNLDPWNIISGILGHLNISYHRYSVTFLLVLFERPSRNTTNLPLIEFIPGLPMNLSGKP